MKIVRTQKGLLLMVRIVLKAIVIALFLLVLLTAILTNRKETKVSTIITMEVLGVIIWVL
jgi:hypothetical protein